MSDPALGWLAAAFAVSWLVIGAYIVRLWRAQRQIDARLEQLSARDGERAEGTGPPG